MITAADKEARWTLAEIGRVLLTHSLDPAPAAAALGLAAGDGRRLIAGEVPLADGDTGGHVRAALLLNILVRLEVRCCHDPVAIRAALERPLAELDGATLTERLLARPDREELAALREAAGTMPVPKVKMWRVADTYS